MFRRWSDTAMAYSGDSRRYSYRKNRLETKAVRDP